MNRMNSSTKNYMCGFNGFKQIDHCKKEMQSNAVKNFVEDDNFFSIPQEVSTQMKLCTWSNFWGITDDKLTCYGYNSLQLTTNLQCNRKDKSSKLSMITVGKYVLIHDNCHTLVIEDDAKICQLLLNKNFVTLVDGTKDHVYGIKEEQIFEGQIVETSGEPCTVKLNFHVISNNHSVKMVSCGFEHTLLLTRGGSVFSFGSGSRGQLGHGEVTVDLIKTPRHVETLSGISVVTIAAGGWHSTTVTDTGDVYVWGWNESGQLGLPNGTITSQDLIASYHPAKKNKSFLNQETELDKCPYHSDVEKRSEDTKYETAYQGKCSELLSSGKEFMHMEKETDTKMKDLDNCAEVSDDFTETDGKTTVDKDVTDENIILKTYQEKSKDEECSERIKKNPDCDSSFEGDCVHQKYYQSIDCVQVQTVPYGLDFPDELNVKIVSCGTRHTCLLSDAGILLTSGWNGYGQLGHGDTVSRDYFETVTHFSEQNESVIYVKAQYWNTYIVTDRKNNIEKNKIV